jgi:hypothetical protein
MPVVLSFDVGIRNLAFCLVDGRTNEEGASNKILMWDVLDIKAKDMETMSSKLVSMLFELFGTENIDQVLIENQPVMKNPTMKSVQMIIYTFFVCAREVGMSPIGKVTLVPASCKNKFCDQILKERDPSSITTAKSSYTQNKKRAVETTRMMVPTEWKDFFDSHKKKDDLADAYLQALCKM